MAASSCDTSPVQFTRRQYLKRRCITAETSTLAHPPPLMPDVTNPIAVRTPLQAQQMINNVKNIARSKCAADENYILYAFLHLHYQSRDITFFEISLLVESSCFIFDTHSVSVSLLSPLFQYFRDSTSARLVVQHSSLAAEIYLRYGEKSDAAEEQSPLTFDIQLGHELLNGTFRASYGDSAKALGVNLPREPTAPLKSGKKEHVQPYVDYIMKIRNVFQKLQKRFKDHSCVQWLQMSTDRVGTMMKRNDSKMIKEEITVGFHKKDSCMASLCVLRSMKNGIDTRTFVKGEEEELELLRDLLPESWAGKLEEEMDRQLIDVEIDLGRPPFAFFRGGKKVILSERREVVATEDILENITGAIGAYEMIGKDNRMGIKGTLHRISVIRKFPSSHIVGMTLRASRHIYGVGTILYDLLFAEEHREKSILLVGPPGSGKTTMNRDIARLLSENHRVMIVDSSDEIAGPGAATHKCVGDARRMSVPGGKHMLANTLIEALENHTPDVIVADELSNLAEVDGAATAKARGVRMIASAHGDLKSLIKNKPLKGLIGGVDRVVMSDRFIETQGGNTEDEKVKALRRGEPVFEVIVEMGVMKGDPTACRVVVNSQQAVDAVLQQGSYACQMRRRGQAGEICFRDTVA